jgi:hypothetical protein
MNRAYRLILAGITIFFLLLVYSNTISAQGKISVSAGWGYYELTNIGIRWNISESSALSIFGGTNFSLYDKKMVATGLSYDHSFRNDLIWKLKPGFSLGAYYWTSDDELYYFSSIALPAMIMLTYPVSESVLLRAEGGGVFNAVMVSDRKQNVEAGYPARGNGNIRLSIIYKIGAK